MKRYLLAFVAFLVFSAPTFAEEPGGVAAKTGRVSFNLDGVQTTFEKVRGDFRQSYGFNVIMLTFTKEGKIGEDRLSISLMIQDPGPVDLNQMMGNGIGWYTKSGQIFTYVKGKSRCTMNVTKLTATSVEGTAECPVINNTFGQGEKTLTGVKFSASAN